MAASLEIGHAAPSAEIVLSPWRDVRRPPECGQAESQPGGNEAG
jgi:hypothetical protein